MAGIPPCWSSLTGSLPAARQVLAGMGCKVQMEAPAADGLLSVDILLAWPDGRGGTAAVALEVGSPTCPHDAAGHADVLRAMHTGVPGCV